jgi:tetratricopeptide (TPR) repeat protein
MAPTLSACLIVRDEERRLGECLASVRGLVDEIVVVDTGSSDATKRIAAGQGARVFDFAWCGDFAAARNHALDHARGDWILSIDADERVRGPAAALATALADPAAAAHCVRLHPRRGFTAYWELRIFRNDPAVRFRGAIHERIGPAVDAYRAARGLRVGRVDLAFDHEGYEGDLSAKHRRDLPLLRRALRQDPGDIYNWCRLSTAARCLGQPRVAARAVAAALALAREAKQPGPEECLAYVSHVEWQLAAGQEDDRVVREGLRRFPRNPQLQWLRARALVAAGRHAEAVPHLRRLVARGAADGVDAMSYDRRIFGAFAYDALARCCFHLGDYARARGYFATAARCEPGNREYRVKEALCVQRAQRANVPRS